MQLAGTNRSRAFPFSSWWFDVLSQNYECLFSLQESVLMAMRSHPFPFRTRKLSSFTLTILGWSRPGKLNQCRHFFKTSFTIAWKRFLYYILLTVLSVTAFFYDSGKTKKPPYWAVSSKVWNYEGIAEISILNFFCSRLYISMPFFMGDAFYSQ